MNIVLRDLLDITSFMIYHPGRSERSMKDLGSRNHLVGKFDKNSRG